MTARPGAGVVAAVVLGHAVAALAHGLSHLAVPVPLAPWQDAFVAVVVIVLPIAGLAFVRRGCIRLGGWALLLGGLGSAVFGTYFHIVAATPDHVSTVTGVWSAPFSVTAVVVSLLALGTAGVGAWARVAAP